MISARIQGVGLVGPGLPDWTTAGPGLRGVADVELRDVVAPVPDILSPRERRRASAAVRLAIAVAAEAVANAGVKPDELASVFGWAHGDGVVVQRILEALTTAERFVSPTDFHNSVHNVAVGYWTIGNGAHQACSSVAAHKDTFPAALLKALAQVKSERRPVLLVILDTPFLEPLNSVCRSGAPFAFALVLTPGDQEAGVAEIGAAYRNAAATEVPPPRTAALRTLWELNAAARAVPLLEHLARGETAALQVPFGPNGRLELELAPC